MAPKKTILGKIKNVNFMKLSNLSKFKFEFRTVMNNLLNCSLLNCSLLNGSLQRPNHHLNIFTSVSLLSTYFQNFSGAADHQRWGNGGLYKKNMLAQLGADRFPNAADQYINNSLHYKISIKLLCK